MENEKPWNEKLMESLRQTGESIRVEAQRLIHQVSDPANHERVKQNLAEMGDWAKKTAEEAAVMVDQAAQKVEAAVANAARRAKKSVKGTKKGKKAARKAKKPARKAKRS